jgi:signal transduction histidine kinase
MFLQNSRTEPMPHAATRLARSALLVTRLGQRLYVRLWLAVVVAVAVLALLVGWAWRLAADPPLREAIIRDSSGQIVGSGLLRRPHQRRAAEAAAKEKLAQPGPQATPPAGAANTEADDNEDASVKSDRRPGPEFAVTMRDGTELYVHLPRPERHFWNRAPYGFFWTLGLVAVAVALSTYPIIRKLTRRLERLQQGVEQWGRGDLTARVPVQGNDEIAFLARRFNHAAERVEVLVQSHKSLLANASHELRSPLTRIRMGLELMGPTDGAATSFGSAPHGSNRDPSAMRTEISRNISELDQLIDEILLASRLDAREADLGTAEAVDLAGLSAEECARVGAELEMPGIDPSKSELAVVGVAKLLRRAVRNLLENARRYGRGDDITAIIQREGGQAVLRVCDRGPGVPVEQRARIFEPFYRLPGASERNGGVGLGLALVKSIAERHGGSVRCEDREGGGAVFVLSLPTEEQIG